MHSRTRRFTPVCLTLLLAGCVAEQDRRSATMVSDSLSELVQARQVGDSLRALPFELPPFATGPLPVAMALDTVERRSPNVVGTNEPMPLPEEPRGGGDGG